MNSNWTKNEVELIVEDYFEMLTKELTNTFLNKTQHRGLLLSKLKKRSAGSIEFKHQNISAVLVLMGLPFIAGYKPRYNFQRDLLVNVIQQYLLANPQFQPLFANYADYKPIVLAEVNFKKWSVPAPELEIAERKKHIRNPIKINYLEREENNAILGHGGEALAFSYEKYMLIESGKANLADQIEWVSKEQGDGLGFDILSKTTNGKDKYIEVKTTRLGKEMPFHFSANEYQFSKENASRYHLYRIFDFEKMPKLFTLQGSFDAFCNIEATNFIGSFR